MKNYKIINSCQITKSKDLRNILNLGFLPPVNQMYKIGEKDIDQNFFNTDLYISKKSKLVQINTVVNKEILFSKDYPYTSSSTKILRDNFDQLFTEVESQFNLKKKFIVDIGSNDGNLLSFFKKKYKVLGVTPENIGKIAIRNGIPTILDYFNKKTVDKIVKKNGKPDLVTATNVFAHIERPNILLKNILNLLDNDGIFVSESHYLPELIKNIQYDTIYHEHLRYYSLQSLKYFFSRHNLKIIDAKKIKTHGGSIRVYATKNKKYKISKNVNKILKEELKFLNFKNLDKFRQKVIFSKLELLKLICKIKKSNKKIVGISAPSRATTLANFVGLDENIIDKIFEISGSKKIGYYLPGTKIPIVNEKLIYKEQPDYALIFSWHISKEIIRNLKMRGYKGKFIVPLPIPKIL